MESEIIAKAHNCKEIFPTRDMVDLFRHSVGLPVRDDTINVSMNEDNTGALVLA